MAIEYLPALPRTAEVVVVGGGIVGAATAFHAARAGLRPLLLERRQALYSLTTAVAAGGFRLQLETGSSSNWCASRPSCSWTSLRSPASPATIPASASRATCG